MLSDEDLEEIMESGERLPLEMVGESLVDFPLENAVFDGVSIVEGGDAHGA